MILNTKIISYMVFSIITVVAILCKDIYLADDETKQKKWFKVYVVYMKVCIGIMIFLSVFGIMSSMKYW